MKDNACLTRQAAPLFIIGGLLGAALLPVEGGLGFWVGGILLGAFGTGAGTLIISKRF